MNNTVYILFDNNKNIWGVYNSEIFLENMINTLKNNIPLLQLQVEEKIMNTNISKNIISNPYFKKNKLVIEKEKDENNETKNCFYNIEIENEVKKIENLYDIFKEDLKSYDTLSIQKIEIPDFFKEKFNVIKKIHDNNIPEKEMFSYYMSNIYLR